MSQRENVIFSDFGNVFIRFLNEQIEFALFLIFLTVMADSIINNDKEVNNSRDRVQHVNGMESTNQSSIEKDEAVNDEDMDTSKDMKIT